MTRPWTFLPPDHADEDFWGPIVEDPGALVLFGQDPLAAWTGPAPFAAAAARTPLSPDETAYLLTATRCVEGSVAEVEVEHGSIRLY